MIKQTRIALTGLMVALAVPALAVDWFKLPVLGGGDAKEQAPVEVVGEGGNSEVNSARVRILNKNTNRIVDVTVAQDKAADGGLLRVSLRRCVRDLQGVPGQDVAWLDVSEVDGGSVYSGWMFNFYTDVAALENPRYDVRLLGCMRTGKVKPIQKGRKAPADVGGVSGPVEDAEAPAEPGTDPNYVPGVGPAAVEPEAGAMMFPERTVEPPVVESPVEETPVEEVPAPAVPLMPPAPSQPAAAEGEQDELHLLMDDYQ